MKKRKSKILFVLLITLLLAGCGRGILHEDIAYKTTKIRTGNSMTSIIDYYIVDKNGKYYPVGSYEWKKLTDIPTR